ncbi:acyl carrier protein [Streptomyces longwoodensis]|uniref:Acyl carrier protein n=1 Tax=Streptomyces novoguineensis TaxID=2586640 RepID=A0A4Y5QS61_9ACTN|nr:Amc10 [Streptomyces novoguineensis]QHW08552.1 acyl carrier protein [Streptomyces novoguineensis]BBE52687.1 acyl carrier protein [Streptomyces sp.]
MTVQDTHTNDEITTVVREFIARLSGRPDIEDDRPLISGGVLDSLAAVQMVDFVERTFQVEVGYEDLELPNFDSVRGLAALVTRRVAA